jgi:hypothetical protein
VLATLSLANVMALLDLFVVNVALHNHLRLCTEQCSEDGIGPEMTGHSIPRSPGRGGRRQRIMPGLGHPG